MKFFGLTIFELVKFSFIFNIANFLWNKGESILIVIRTFRRYTCLLYVLYIRVLLQWVRKLRRNETMCRSMDKIIQEGGADRPCFYFGDEIWTYKQVQVLSFRVANYFQKMGIEKGDTVGLAMNTRLEVIAIWLGLGRIGCVTVMINTNFRGDSLKKCASVVKCKALIIGTELRDAFEEIWSGTGMKLLPSDIYELDRFLEVNSDWKPGNKVLWEQNKAIMPTVNLAKCLLLAGKKPPVLPQGQETKFLDPLLYLFTSGTTDVPKAVRCSHGRLFFISSIASTLNFTSKDSAYSAVPTYHINGLFAIVWSFCYGVHTVLVVKFTATNFWKHVDKYKVTLCTYIGEFCRFLLSQPSNPDLERGRHTLRAMIGGGGLRGEVWAAFMERFGVKKFVDLYGSSEGNCTMINLVAKVGSCGYIPLWLQSIHPIQLVKVDDVTGEICRDMETGFAIKCKDGEVGELIGKIIDSIPVTRFDGYTDPVATEKQIARNVFTQGDKYFRSGDAISRDKFGYFYFHDRIAENVASTLVEGVISQLTGMRNNVVYGVKVPGTEGTAGMAAILDSDDGEFSIQKLADGMKQSLPNYAMPMFIRLVKGLDVTSTLKFQKFRVKQEGFDIEKIDDPFFIYCYETESYKKLDLQTFREVMNKNYRF